MNYQTRNGEQVGDLIHYIDYTSEQPQDYIGVLVNYDGFADMYVVICEGQVTEWLAWQCEVIMQIGDLVDDGLGNIGVIVELGWIFPESVSGKIGAYQVHFPSNPQLNGWYDDYDLKLISYPMEATCK